jgi:hypothetical protein
VNLPARLIVTSLPSPLAALKRALILDLETWQGKPDEIVEVGLILTAYDPSSGELLGETDRYGGLRDPGPRATAKPSGRITAKMVKGKELRTDQIEALIGQSDVIISQNAFGFDNRFERLFPSSKIATLALLIPGFGVVKQWIEAR